MAGIAPPKPPRCYNIVSLRTAAVPLEEEFNNIIKSGSTIKLDECLFTNTTKANENLWNDNSSQIKVNSRLIRGCSRLMYACQHGLTDTVVRELRAKPERVRQRDSSNKSVLHYCSGQSNIVAAASVAVAAPDLLESADEDGFTPLHLAVIQGNLAMVNLLLANKADVNAVDNEGHSVVHWATVCGEVEALRSILQSGANVNTPDINGGSPLHYAAQMCGSNYDSKLGQPTSSKLALEVLDILLAHPQSSIDITDKDGRKPLLWAASAGSAKAVLALVKAGSRVESADKDGLTALHCAASRGHTECIDTLISLCGAPTDLIDSNGCTALHYAVTLGHADATSRLLDLDADPNRQDRKGRTPAHCGCSKGQLETVKLLKEWGANLWLRNAKGDLPLHEAASSGRRELVEWLLAQKPKQVNTTSNDGRSLLHIASSYDYTDICKLLIDYGADVNSILRTSKGVAITPLDCALQKGFRATAKFLQSNGGLPASKLHLSGRKPNAFNERDLVKPLKYTDRDDLQTCKNTKKCAKKLRKYDSDSSDVCSCNEHTYKKEHTYTHTCKHHRKRFRRRTSSCGEAKNICREDSCSDICRSKSNIEIRRRQSRDRIHTSDSEDSCENCCYHKKKQKIKRKERTSRKTKEIRGGVGEYYEGVSNINDSATIDKASNVHEAECTKKDEKCIARQFSGNQDKDQCKPGNMSNTINSMPVLIPEPMSLTDDDVENPEVVLTKADVHAVADNQELISDEIPTANLSKPSEVIQEGSDVLSDGNIEIISKEIDDVLEAAKVIIATNTDTETTEKESISEENVQQSPEEAIADILKKDEKNKLKQKENENDSTTADLKIIQQTQAQTTDVVMPESRGATETQIVPEQDERTSFDNKEEKEEIKQDAITSDHAGSEKDELPEKESLIQTKTDIESGKELDAADETKTSGSQLEKPTEPEDPMPLPLLTQSAEPIEPNQPTKSIQTKPISSPQSLPEESSTQNRDQESRRSFTLLPDSPNNLETQSRKSSFHILKSDESVDLDDAVQQIQKSETFQVISDIKNDSKLNTEFISDVEAEDNITNFIGSAGRVFPSHSASVGHNDYANGRKRRLKRRVKSGGARGRNHGKLASKSSSVQSQQHLTNKDHDSGFEPSPRAIKTKIPTPRSSYTAYVPRKAIYTTLDGRLCSSRLENRKPGDKGACDMSAVTRSIQRNVRRYYMERKIFQHLLELKNLQIRSNKLNEAVLVKRAVDEYHKSCIALGGETGTTLRRYPYSEYTFKNFELFLYETLKSLQRPGTFNFQNINDVYEEAERRLSPDYNAYEKALQCTTKTHRCLHATHAYTGIPCAAYIPMMNHHTIPKFGFGPYKKTGAGSFYLPKILSSHPSCGSRVSLELSHGKNKQLISLPSEKLDSNKRYYVTFTIKEPGGKQQLQHQQQQHPLTQDTAYEDNMVGEKACDQKKTKQEENDK